MFPSQGYFYSINCQDFLNGKCNRAYCHFLHNEKLQKFTHNNNSSNDVCDNLGKQPPLDRYGELHKNFEASKLSSISTDVNDICQNTSVQIKNDSIKEVSTSDNSSTTTPDILSQLIGEAVKKVLSENSTLKSLAIDSNSFIKSLDASNIVSKAAEEISTVHMKNISGKKQPKLYLPPPGTPSYKPTPISELNNKYNFPRNSKSNFETQEEYTPTLLSCEVKNDEDEITDFSSDDDDDDDSAKSDFDMLEEVLVEKLSSDPERNKAIQKRKKALRKLSAQITSNASVNDSKSSQERLHHETSPPQNIALEFSPNSVSIFDPPSPVFTSSADANVPYPSEQKSVNSLENCSIDSQVSSIDNKLMEINTSSISTKVKKIPISSTHNLLPQIAELARPNVKSWTPVAKVDSIFSVEKMLEQLDRIDNVDKNLTEINNTNTTLPDDKVPCALGTRQSLTLEEKKNNTGESSVIQTNKDDDDVNLKFDNSNTGDVILKEKSDTSVNLDKDNRQKSIGDDDDGIKISNKDYSQERSYRKRAGDSDSNTDKRKRKRSRSSSRKKKKHKRKYSSLDDSSQSEDSPDDRRDSSGDHYSKRRKKHKKYKGKKAKQYKKKNKHDRSRSRSRKRRHSREKRYSSDDTSRSDSSPKKCPKSKSDSVHKDFKLLAPHQIKQEKIEVDLSIVKIENDKGSVKSKDELTTKSNLLSSENNEIDSYLPSTKPTSVLQNKPDTEMNACKSAISVKEDKISQNLRENNNKRNSHSESNISDENLTKLSDSTKSKSSKTLQSLNESKQVSLNYKNINEKSENSLTPKTYKAVSLKSKLESYTSSLLAKVSDTNSDILRPRTNSSDSSKSFSVNQDLSTSFSNSTEVCHKSLKNSQGTTSKKDTSYVINSPKSKNLKEFSIFEGLKEFSDTKRPSKSQIHSSKSYRKSENKSQIHREKSYKKSEDKNFPHKNLREKTVHSESESVGYNSKEREKYRKKEHSSTKSSSHSSHKEKDKRKESHSSRENLSKSIKGKEINERKSSSHTASKHKESSGHKTKNSKDLKKSDKKSEKDSKTDIKGKIFLEEHKHSHPSPDDSPTGTDSPIPDLSALDEIPKEDWDQLLSNSSDKVDNSDLDEGIDTDQNFPVEDDISDYEEDVNNPKVLEECKKLFSEYDPTEYKSCSVPKKECSKSENDAEDIVPAKKLRVAYTGAAGNLIAKPKALLKPHRKTPAEIMLQRYKKLKEEEIQLQKKLEIQRKELEKHGRLPPPSLAISSSSVSSTSDPSPISQPTVSSTSGKKRIAIAPKNVSALLKSKELLQAKPTSSTNKILVAISSADQTTPAMTNSKGSKRIAHIPKVETIERPVVSTEEGTKVPQNIRQRYLNCFIDETLKFCDGDSHAYNVALAEESICHKRATTRMVYLNLAVNVLKKLRASQISEAAQELLLNDPKYKETRENRLPPQSLVSSSSASLTAGKNKFIHPVNPNHRTVSHFSVMSAGGQKGTWSIQKPKRSLPDNINDYLTGSKFYKCLKKYILSTELLEENGFPRSDPLVKGKAILKKINSRKRISPSENERYCDRCSVLYKVDKWGLPIGSAPCIYHWGRAYKSRGIGGLESKYSCCQGDSQSEGCCIGTTHVSENFSPNSLTSYVRTIPKSPNKDGDFGVYALDCEMCYTTAGSELTRVTVVDTDCKSVYETLVKPDNPIIDYNTRFSGITEEDMEGVSVRLRDVQAALLTRFSDKTILMGHSLESDFAALKIIHDTVVDTSVVFPHKLGPPFKRALRNLASEYLSKIIQNDEGGHDSAEDANTCMELMKRKIKEDLKGQF